MPLTIELKTPKDALAKARREHQELAEAISCQDKTRIGDALYNFAVSVYHVKDWLIETPSAVYTKKDVEDYLKATPALTAFRDLCNSSKHHTIHRYTPEATDVTSSSMASYSLSMPKFLPFLFRRKLAFRVKIIMTDGRRLEAISLGKQALDAWDNFFNKQGVLK